MKNYYKIRANHPHIFGQFHPSAQLETIKLNLQCILDGRDRAGCSVFIFKGGKWDPKSTKAEDIFKANVMFLEQCIQDPVTQVGFSDAVFGVTCAAHFPSGQSPTSRNRSPISA